MSPPACAGWRPFRAGRSLEAIVDEETNQHAEAQLESRPWGDNEEQQLRTRLRHTLQGLGPLQEALEDPEVEEIWINAPDQIFIARAGVSEQLPLCLDADQVRALVERMLRPTGRRVDVSQPFVDASLPDGSRVHVVIPDITREHWSVNIRKFSRSIRDPRRPGRAGSAVVTRCPLFAPSRARGKNSARLRGDPGG